MNSNKKELNNIIDMSLIVYHFDNGTNNLSERELRNMAIKRNLSYGSDTYLGMENTAIIGSVMQTLHRNKDKPFIPTLKTHLQTGMQEKYQQYIHTAYYDS
jgi:hypothetical protein